ncbi:MAG: hypothetical protein EZS28_041681, partial [Streblomastix strix]
MLQVGLYNQLFIIYVLSEYTEVGDLLGRKMLRRKGTSMLSYVPDILAEAYGKVQVLLLDEFYLCQSKVLSSILSTFDGNMIKIEGKQIAIIQNFVTFPLTNREEYFDIFSQRLHESNPQNQIVTVTGKFFEFKKDIQTFIDKEMYLKIEFEKKIIKIHKPRDTSTIYYPQQISTADRVQFKKKIDLARFVAYFIRSKIKSKLQEETPSTLLDPESTVENINGSFNSQEMKSNETDLTKLIKQEDEPLIDSDKDGTSVILDRIDEAKAHINESLNQILEKNARRDKTQFFAPQRDEAVEQQEEQGFKIKEAQALIDKEIG